MEDISPAKICGNKANGTAQGMRKYRATRIRVTRDPQTYKAPPVVKLPYPDDPWTPQLTIFRREDDEDFQKKLEFVQRYVSQLAKFVQKMEKERATKDEWRTLAQVINRFFLVVTVVGFGLTAVLFYVLVPAQN